MEVSNRPFLNNEGPPDEADRLIGHGGMEAFAPIPSIASQAHTQMDIWSARLEHANTPVVAEQLSDAADPAAVVAEDAVADQPTTERIQAIAAQADAEEATGEQIQDNGVRMGSLLPYATYDEYLEASERANSCPLSEYSFREAKAGTVSHFSTYEDYTKWAAEHNAKCKCGKCEKVAPISETFFHESKELASELRDRSSFEETMMSIGITQGQNDAYMKWCKAKDVYQYDLRTFECWRESMKEPTNEHVQEACAIQQGEDAARSNETDWVAVENGEGFARQITETQYEEDLAAGLLVDVGGYLMYKSEMHRAPEESDDEYLSRLDAKIQRVNAERVADRLIGHGGMEALLPIPPAATPAHRHMDEWAACLGDVADLTPVVEKDSLTDEPTPDQIAEAQQDQAEAEQERAADLGIPVELLPEFDRLMDSNIPWPDELQEWWNHVGREREPAAYFDFDDGTRLQVPIVLHRWTSSPPLGGNHGDAVAHWMRIIHGITNDRHQEVRDWIAMTDEEREADEDKRRRSYMTDEEAAEDDEE
jgi:hypothetical protein